MTLISMKCTMNNEQSKVKKKPLDISARDMLIKIAMISLSLVIHT